MAKTRKGGGSASSKKKTRLWQAVLVVGVVGVMIGAYVLREQGASGDDPGKQPGLLASGSGLRNRLVLPASPIKPRPVTLNPAAFTDPEVRQAYQAAKDTPEPLEYMACYCGCFGTSGHRNNLDCFKDNHGAT